MSEENDPEGARREWAVPPIPNTHPNFKAEIGKRLALRRRELGLTQKALSERVGLSRDFLAQVEVGRLEINVGDLPRLCVMLGVPVSYFLSGLVTSPTTDPTLNQIRKLSAVAQGELTPEEVALLRHFRAINDKGRELLSDLAFDLARVKEALGDHALAVVTEAEV